VRSSFFAILFLAAFVSAAPDPASAATAGESRRPYTDSEVEAALARPLTLEDCVRIAGARSYSLRIARGDLSRAEKAHWRSYGQYLPELSVVGVRRRGESTVPAFDSLGLPMNAIETDLVNRQVVGGVAQTLPLGTVLSLQRDLSWERTTGTAIGSTSARFLRATVSQPLLRSGPMVAFSPVRDADYERESQEKLLDDAMRQTLHATRLAWYEVLSTRERVRIGEEALRSDSVLVQASEAMLSAKMATRRDILSAQIRQAEDRASLVATQKDQALALDQLKEVMGVPLDLAIAVADAPLAYEPVALDESELIRTATAASPAVQSAELLVQRSRLQLRVARNSALPSLNVTGSYLKQLDRDHDLRSEASGSDWTAGFSLSYPLLSRDGAAAADIARIELNQQEERREILKRRITLEVRDAVRSIASIAEEIAAIERGVSAAEEKIEFANAMFNLGRASNLDITDAREAWLKSRNQYVQRLADYHGQLSALESLTGLPLAR
jgi:outer membrane protein TolC